jgi:hypothetical protein
MSIFQQYKKILEESKIGETISRQELKAKLNLEANSYMIPKSSSITTLDNYRRAFELACFIKLDRSRQRLGAYKKIKEIDSETCKSISSLKKENALFMKNIPKDDEHGWRSKWIESKLSAKDFIHKHRGKLNGIKFDL